MTEEIHNTLIDMGFDYEECIDAYCYKRTEAFLEKHNIHVGFVPNPFSPNRFRNEDVIKEASKYIFLAGIEVMSEFMREYIKGIR